MLVEKISKSKLQIINSLKQKKNRKELGLFVAEGQKCVTDTINSFELYMLIATGEWIDDNIISQSYKNISIEGKLYNASRQEISKVSSLSTPPDVIAVYRMPEPNSSKWEKDITNRLTIVLDGIQDPGNLGTIIRSADWFGVHHILASKTTVDLFNAKTIQATMGAISRVKILYDDIKTILMKYPDLPVYGTLLDGENIYSADLKQKGFIIFGNEGKGITDSLRKLVTESLFIPSYPKGVNTSESLNVAMAATITLAEFRRRLQS